MTINAPDGVSGFTFDWIEFPNANVDVIDIQSDFEIGFNALQVSLLLDKTVTLIDFEQIISASSTQPVELFRGEIQGQSGSLVVFTPRILDNDLGFHINASSTVVEIP